MRRVRLGLILMGGGLAVKGAAVIAFPLFHPPVFTRALTTYDPLGVLFANAVLPLFFDLRGIAPPPGAPAVYDLLLVVAFAAQCFILGFAIIEVHRSLKKQRGSQSGAPSVLG